MSLTTNWDDNKNVFICCGAFSITSPLLCPVLLATHVICSEIIVGANADPMALMRTRGHREIRLFAGGHEGRHNKQ